MPKGFNLLTPKERAWYGAIVTVREQTTRAMKTLHRTEMTALDAVREIAAEIDRLDGEWRIVCISTPTTVFRDLQGARTGGTQQRYDGTVGTSAQPYKSEVGYLSKIGRLDLLAPLSLGATAEARSERSTRRRSGS